MGNFFTSLFSSSKPAEATEDKAKNEQKNFDILKYDGVRAQKMGKLAYAIKCFTEALNIQEDFETMSYLVSAYTMANELGKAEDVLNRMVEMEPDHIATRLTRVNLLFMLDKDAEVITDCLHVIELEPSNHVAYFIGAVRILSCFLLTLAIRGDVMSCTSFSYVLLRLIGKHDRIRTAP